MSDGTEHMGKFEKKNGELYGGVDIGGTKIYSIITKADGKIIARAKKKTKADRGFEAVMERVGECLKEACEEAVISLKDLDAVGVGAPSAISADGKAVNAPNMGWKDAPITKELEKVLDVKVATENDANLGTLGEYVYGVGKGSKTLVGFLVGTGLGGGIVCRGEIIRGENRLAAELGHIIVQANGRKCGCGHHGCLEAYASKAGMGKRFIEEIKKNGRKSMLTDEPDIDLANVPSSVLLKAYEAGDKVVTETLEEAMWYLGVGVANMITVLGPDMVVLGGGVMEAMGKHLIKLVKESARALAFPPPSYDDTKIVLSELGDDAVALGAVAYARGKGVTRE